MTDKLKPCPFCGGEAGLNEVEDGHGGLSGAYVVCLNGCNVQATPITWNTRADDWQPIETAPKDVKNIIGMNGNSIFKLYRHEDCSGYFESEWLTFDDDDEFNPTHWKPLPEPPTGEE